MAAVSARISLARLSFAAAVYGRSVRAGVEKAALVRVEFGGDGVLSERSLSAVVAAALMSFILISVEAAWAVALVATAVAAAA
jgi:hypothetical protein